MFARAVSRDEEKLIRLDLPALLVHGALAPPNFTVWGAHRLQALLPDASIAFVPNSKNAIQAIFQARGKGAPPRIGRKSSR